MKELSDDEMQNVDGGAGNFVYLNTTKLKTNHYFYPKKTLVKQANDIYVYDQSKGQRTLLNNQGKLRLKLGNKYIRFKRTNGKTAILVHCIFDNLGDGYINSNVETSGAIEYDTGKHVIKWV